ncbi:MAG: recombinase family protein [Candidatus Margulisbacteria bacterium]|nr:recombinase family protein [Candidatus Margulisiibacteriota bacterium]
MFEKKNLSPIVVDLYIRVSTDRQANEGDSLIEQEEELRRFCEFRKFKIKNILIERGKSASNTNRPEYQKLLADIKEQRINAVVVKKLDRLSRSLLDFEQFSKLTQEKDVDFISLKENFDTTNAMGKAMLRIALVFAQLEREQTSERVIDVMIHRASQGFYNGGRRPYGYANINKELSPHPKEKKIVEILFTKFLETRSTTQTADFLNSNGYRDGSNHQFDARQINSILRNPLYTGKLRWSNHIYDGLHQPIISETQFQRVQELFKRGKIFLRVTKSNAALAGLLYCGSCESRMSPTFSYNPLRKKYYYYHCNKSKNQEERYHAEGYFISFIKIETQVKNALLSLAQDSQYRLLENRILKYNQKIEEEIQNIDFRSIELKAQLKAFSEKKEYYLDSLISSPFLSSEREMIQAKIKDLELQEIACKTDIDKQDFLQNEKYDEKIKMIEFKKKLIAFKLEYLNFSSLQFKEYLREILSAILYYPDKLVMRFKLLPWDVEVEKGGLY